VRTGCPTGHFPDHRAATNVHGVVRKRGGIIGYYDPGQVRLAKASDIPALRQLIEVSVRSLSAGYYAGPQIESALRYVFGPDTQLIADQTYYVVEDATAELIGAGGWSRRRTLYGGDQLKDGADPLLNPATDAARIRAFFVHPRAARCGLGRRIFQRCAMDAAQAGFRTLELMATLPGEQFYLALGFVSLERSEVTLPDGEILEIVRMVRPLAQGTLPEQGQCF
jgi:GNAT superfamily N-acetyltransferase